MNSLFSSSISYIKKNHICINEEEFMLELYTHPDYPSLLALTDTLSLLKVKYKVGECDYNDLLKNKQLALTLLESDFVVIQKVNGDNISYYDSENNLIKRIDKEDFEKKWNHSVLYITNENQLNGFFDLESLLHKYKEWLLILGITLLITFTYNWTNIYCILLLFTKIAGIYFSILQTKYHQKKQNILLSNLCKEKGEISCNSVLNSKYSKILGLSLIDIGMTYFGTTFLVLIYYNIINDISLLYSLLGISLCTLPAIGISLFYQGIIIKKWCPLCLGTMTTLLTEILISLIFFLKFNNWITLNIQSIFILFIFTLLFGYTWGLWRSNIENKQISIKNRLEFLRIKKNSSIFKEQLSKSQRIECYQSNYTPNYGNNNNDAILTIIMNIHCTPCIKAHSDLMELYSLFPEKLKIHILFTGNLTDENDSRNDISLYLLHVFNQFGTTVFEKELSTILNSSTNKKSVRNYKFQTYREDIKNDYYNCLEWLQTNRISETPTILLNNKKLPSIYQISDLKYYINDI